MLHEISAAIACSVCTMACVTAPPQCSRAHTSRLRACLDDAGGALQTSGKWTGVVGELVDGNADVALFPLTRTLARSQAVDLTHSFLDAGLSLLVQDYAPKPGRGSP